jgi:hypothetical protein
MSGSGPHDELAGIARQLAAVSEPLRMQIASMQHPPNAFVELIRSANKAAERNGLLLSSVNDMLFAQRMLGPKSTRMTSILGANQNLVNIVGQGALLRGPVSAVLAAQLKLPEMVISPGVGASLAASIAKLNASGVLAASLAAQEKLAGLDRLPLGRLIAADTTFRRSASAHLGQVTRAYEALMSATASQAGPPVHNYLGTVRPPVDYYRHVKMLESITTPAQRHDSPGEAIHDSLEAGSPTIDELLLARDQSLHPLLLGARQSLLSMNVDRPRHVTTSLRELFTQVLHELAPDQEVSVSTSNGEHFHNGRPTRRARLLYVCRGIDEGPLSAFVQTDVSAALALVDSLSAGTHVVRSKLTEEQLRSLVARMESLLSFLLQLDAG